MLHGVCRNPEFDADHDIGHHLRSAEIAERGLMDFLFFADLAVVRDTDRPSMRRDMEQSHLKLEPSLICAALAAATSRIGLVPTMSTSFHQPYNLARRLASIDHISNGRAGWNMVTSTDPDEAKNFSQERPLDSVARHARAREFLGVVRGLWDSWDDDAFMRDKASGQYFHRDKFHFLDHQGEYFRVRGPLDTARPPQGHLPIITAGASHNAQDLAAEVADMVYSAFAHLDMAQEYYASVKSRLAKYGRSQDSLRVMTGIMPVIGRTREEAQAKFDQLQDLLDPRVANGMLMINQFPDLSAYGLDDKVPQAEVRDVYSHRRPRPRVDHTADATRPERRHDHPPTSRRCLSRLLASRRHRHAHGCGRHHAELVRTGGSRRFHRPAALSAWFGHGFRGHGDPGAAAPGLVPARLTRATLCAKTSACPASPAVTPPDPLLSSEPHDGQLIVGLF